MLEAREDLFVKHNAKPPGAFIILKFDNTFCCIQQSLPHSETHTLINTHRHTRCTSSCTVRFAFPNMCLQYLLLCLQLFSYSLHFLQLCLSLLSPSPILFPLSLPPQSPGVISKVSIGDSVLSLKVITQSPMLPLFPSSLPLPFSFSFSLSLCCSLLQGKYRSFTNLCPRFCASVFFVFSLSHLLLLISSLFSFSICFCHSHPSYSIFSPSPPISLIPPPFLFLFPPTPSSLFCFTS